MGLLLKVCAALLVNKELLLGKDVALLEGWVGVKKEYVIRDFSFTDKESTVRAISELFFKYDQITL